MNYLGKITQLHLAITEEEQNMLVNALSFFHAIYDPERDVSIPELISEWRDVADDTRLEGVDGLATKIATLR